MNKLKGSSNAIRMKHLLILFVVSLLLALPIRTYQLLVLVNPENGFYENGDFTVPVLFGAVAVFTLLFVVLSFVSKSVPAPKIKTGKNPLLGIASLLLAGGFVWDVIVIERRIVPQINNNINVDIFRNLFSVYLKENGGTFLVLELIFAILAALYFLIFAISHFEGKPHYKKLPIIALAPLCWCMSVLVSKLMKAISFITVSELLFEIFMLVFAMLFFLTFARICSGVFTENSMWGIFGYGFAAAFFGAVVTIPRLVVLFMDLEPVDGNEFSFTHLTIFIFTVVFILSAIGVGFKHGLKNIKTVSELELPDDEDVVVKGSDVAYITEVADNEIEYVTDIQKNEETVIEEVLSYGIDEALDDYLEEIETESITETAENITEEPVIETVEEVIEEPVAEIVEEVTEEPVAEIVEEVTEEPVIETVEEVTEEPVIETVEEVAEEPVAEIVEEVTEEPVVKVIEEVTEEPVVEIIEEATEETMKNDVEISEEFVDFSEMLIEESDEFEDETEQVTEPEIIENKTEIIERENSSKNSTEEKKKVQKTSKTKKIFGKNKKKNASEEETIKIVSLADLKKESE